MTADEKRPGATQGDVGDVIGGGELPATDVVCRLTTEADFPGIIALTKSVYPDSLPYQHAQLLSQRRAFPEGQFVVVDGEQRVLGMAASLIVCWDDYTMEANWRDMTDAGRFTNHDPTHGRTLYGAEVMVDPDRQGHGVGSLLYEARRELVQRLRLLRIRAGARLRGYGKVAHALSAEEYVTQVVRGERVDPTLSFQLNRGFVVLAVVKGYLGHDPDSQGWAAVIEWLNPEVARPEDAAGRDARFVAP